MQCAFSRYQTFSRVPSRNRGKRSNETARSVEDILSEAGRKTGFCNHVAEPKPPIMLYGSGLDAVRERVRTLTDGAVDRRGHRVRQDALVMLGAVMSWPVPKAATFDGGAMEAEYRRWRELVVAFCRESWGDCLVTVAEHVDEEYPHIHAYAVPFQRDCQVDIGDVDLAAAADRRVRNAGGSRCAQMTAHNAEKRAYQDRYHQMCGAVFGHLRVGPKRARLSRDEIQHQDRLIQSATDSAACIEEDARKRGNEASQREVEAYHRSRERQAGDPVHRRSRRDRQPRSTGGARIRRLLGLSGEPTSNPARRSCARCCAPAGSKSTSASTGPIRRVSQASSAPNSAWICRAS